jgi:DNA-binding NarL/FixJ family response regulator
LSSSTLRGAAWQALLSSQPEIEVAGVSADLEALLPLMIVGPPAALLADVPPPLADLARHLKATAPQVGVLFLVPEYDLAEVLPLLQAGALGCVALSEGVPDLVRGLIAAGRGEIVLPPAIAAQALVALARGEAPAADPAEPLSEREAEILGLLAQGLTNKDIAQTLVLSVRTVEAHLRSLFGKLGVRSRTEAALWAVRHNYGNRSR